MGSGFSKMKKQARMLEQQFETLRSELKNKQFIGTSGNGLVSVTVNGEKEIIGLNIQPECVRPDDIEGLQDLILAACQHAYSQTGNESPLSPFSL